MQKKITLIFLIFMVAMPLAIGHTAEYYKGKTIKLIVSTKPGGGYDLYARMVAKFMQKYLPGSKIIVKNRPGAGHIIGCSEIFHSKPWPNAASILYGNPHRRIGIPPCGSGINRK